MTIPGEIAGPALEWALTYALHSTLLLGLVALLTHRLVRSDVWRETLWRGALFGSVLTAAMATSLPFAPLAGRLEVPGIGTPSSPAADAAVRTGRSSAATGAPASPRSAAPGRQGPAERRSDTGADTGAGSWGAPILFAWVGASSLLLALLLLRNVALFRRLRGRRRLTEGALVAMLAEQRRRAGVWRPVRLSVSESCPTPLVIGSSEICVPPRFLEELDEGAQRAALAHELAHIRRRDPQWQLATGVLGALLFFQPLTLWARLRLREASEHLCDDWTVRQTGSALHLGRCLTEIASWMSADPPLRLDGTPAMAEGGSPLVHRIRRIAEGVPAVPELRLWPTLTVVGSLLAVLAAVPVVAGSVPAEGAEEAVERAAAGDTLATIALLEELAMGDPSMRVREEAVAELSDFDHPEAARALMRIVRRASDPIVRAEAAQQLDEFETDEVVAVLLEVVFRDSVADVREAALYTLEDFALVSATAGLRRVAREHPRPEVRVAALNALADGGG